MEHITVGKKFNAGRAVPVEVVENGALGHIQIKNRCFLLIILTEGRLNFRYKSTEIHAVAPAFICFDETEEPLLLSKRAARYICIYFHPTFLNVNMQFEMLRSKKYSELAQVHDMFLLRPFLEGPHCLPIVAFQLEKICHAASAMAEELTAQRDWYWSCRGRSYFMEIMIALERTADLFAKAAAIPYKKTTHTVKNKKLRDALLFIEGHYAEKLNLSAISKKIGLNHTTLTALCKAELGCTLTVYLTHYRIANAQKKLAFTDVPIKDIAGLTGFKTVQHFARIFKNVTGETPAEFRKDSVQKRKRDFL